MLTVIVYGRNDAFGQEAQRRAALSLNALAEELDHADDEILFVDYNTRDDLVTFPELIADTLTVKTRENVRVIRVRPAFHATVEAEGPPVFEALARNIALRRARPSNRWVLSTNTDVVFAGAARPLSVVIADLPDGLYGAPRFEIPRFIWERLDRSAPTRTREQLTQLADDYCMRERVRQASAAIGFDAPGDFQLFPKDIMVQAGGFDERLRLGWHVDAAAALKLGAILGDVKEVPRGPELFHCEHTSSTATKHHGGRQEDGLTSDGASDPDWGRPGIEFESFNLSERASVRSLDGQSGPKTVDVLEFTYGEGSYGTLPLNDRHVASYVVDHLIRLPGDVRVGWAGRTAMREAVVSMLEGRGPLISEEWADADRIIFDLGGDALDDAWGSLAQFVTLEQERLDQGCDARPIVFVNAVHSDFEASILRYFDCILSPVTTRLRPARMRRQEERASSWLSALEVGEAGKRDDGRLSSQAGMAGYVMFGPNRHLVPGEYEVELQFDRRITLSRRPELFVEVVTGSDFLARRRLSRKERRTGLARLNFTSSVESFRRDGPGVEVRIWTGGRDPIRIDDVIVRRVKS